MTFVTILIVPILFFVVFAQEDSHEISTHSGLEINTILEHDRRLCLEFYKKTSDRLTLLEESLKQLKSENNHLKGLDNSKKPNIWGEGPFGEKKF